MWSFGCILAELVNGRPLFPAIDEKELLEWILIRIGHIPEHMIKNCTKRRQFYDANFGLIRSARSRIPRGSQPQCDSIRNALYSEDDDEFIDFIEVSQNSNMPKELHIQYNTLFLIEMSDCWPCLALDSWEGLEAQLDQEKQGPVNVQGERAGEQPHTEGPWGRDEATTKQQAGKILAQHQVAAAQAREWTCKWTR